MKDLHKNISVVHVIKPVAVGTTGIAGGQLSAVIDRRGYDSVEFLFNAGGSASVADTINPVVYESAATGSGFTSVANADLIGDETALTLTTSAGKAKGIGYRGNKRYLKLRLYGLGTATALVAATAILARPNIAPIVT
jgi:hypothetical protein